MRYYGSLSTYGAAEARELFDCVAAMREEFEASHNYLGTPFHTGTEIV